MSWVFGQSIETRHGNFAKGQPLPPEWDTRETRRFLLDKYGKDAVLQVKETSNAEVAERLSAIEGTLASICAALDIKADAKKLDAGKGRA